MSDLRPLIDQAHQWRETFMAAMDKERPHLHRFCRHLTRDLWDAEDLVQDTLVRAMGQLGQTFQMPTDFRAWILRIAHNLWIDGRRRKDVEERHHDLLQQTFDTARTETAEPDPVEIEESLALLLHHLPARNCACIVLKDLLGYRLQECADILGCSLAAVKKALHNGRQALGSLAEREDPPVPIPTLPDAELVKAFAKAFNERDIPALTLLLAPQASVNVLGLVQETDRDQILNGSLPHTLAEPGDPRARIIVHAGEAVMALEYLVDGERRLRDVVRFRTEDGLILHYRHYYFCPEILLEFAKEHSLAVNHNGYRFVTPIHPET